MAASLGKDLILDVQPSGAGPLVLDHCSHRLLEAAETGVGIGDDRQARGVGDTTDLRGELVQGEQPDIRHAGGDAQRRARDVAALEARVGDRTAGKGVERARQRDRPALGGGAKPRRG